MRPERIEEIHHGDVVWKPPGAKRRHGASPTMAMTHIVIQEQLDGKSADWMEHVSDEQYQGKLTRLRKIQSLALTCNILLSSLQVCR